MERAGNLKGEQEMKRCLCIFLAVLLFLGAVLPATTAAEFTTEPMISAGGSHTVALRSDGTVWAWGFNNHGQVGDGTRTNRRIPVRVQYLSNITAIAAGNFHTVALRNDGTVWIWGLIWDHNFTDAPTRSHTPIQVQGLSNVTAIAAGWGYTLVLRDDGTVWILGRDLSNPFGDHSTIDHYTPIQVQGLSNITAIVAGWLHAAVLRDDGTIWAWGDNWDGRLGDGTTTNRHIPVQIQGLSNVTAIAAGYRHTVVLKNNGTVWTMGANDYGQLGNSPSDWDIYQTRPAQVQGLSDITAITAGAWHAVTLRNDGTVWAWGQNWSGQLGDDTTWSRYTPMQVQNLSDVKKIVAGFGQTIAFRNDGTVWAWGRNRDGELGDGTNQNRYTPAPVLGPRGIGYLDLTERTPLGLPFDDVPESHWAYNAITFVCSRSLMQGTTASVFAPDERLTRAMATTILHRLAGEWEVPFYPMFDDVPEGLWFSTAVTWASTRWIVDGTGQGIFAPHAPITREQLVTMLYRHARYMRFSTEVSDDFDLTTFPDYAQVNPWAADAMRWAVYNGLITGTSPTTLSPQGSATRAQSATILMRFIEENQ